jgi:hypothetical protein
MDPARHEGTASAELLSGFGELPDCFPNISAVYFPTPDGFHPKLCFHDS